MSQLNLGDSLILDTDYSTSEVKTGATWIDGKPIYTLTKQCNYASAINTDKTYAHGIAHIDQIIKIEGYTTDNTPNFYNVNFAANGSYAIAYATRASIGVNTSYSGLLNRAAYVTIYYTKTTD